MVLEIHVDTASSQEEAVAIARRIATSPLVKTAAFGHDPNWGRVLMAAGSAPYNGGFARLDTERLTVAFDGVPVFAAGAPTGRVPELAGLRAASTSRSVSATARPRISPPTCPTTTFASTRSTRHEQLRAVSRIVLKLGGRVAVQAAERVHELRAEGHDVSSCTEPDRRSRQRCRGSQLPRRLSMAAA